MGFSPEEVVHTWQEHTDIILRVGKSDCGKGLFRNQPDVCDGLITNEPGVALVCFAADCTPILFYDPVQRLQQPLCFNHQPVWKRTPLYFRKPL